jgi:ribosomal protein S4
LYAERLAVSDGQNHAFINGKHFDVDDVRVSSPYLLAIMCGVVLFD